MSETARPHEGSAPRKHEPGNMNADGSMKIVMYAAGVITGLHEQLDAIRDGFNPHNPIDHNVEQAQLALETAVMRLGQLTKYFTDRLEAEASEGGDDA